MATTPEEKKRVAWAKRIWKLFRLTAEDYDRILAHQGGVCYVCGKPPKSSKRLAVDHDHRSGLVRGLLCNFCNRAIGVLRDNLEKFARIVEYLRSPPATAALGGERFGIKGRTSNKAKTMKKLNPGFFDNSNKPPGG